LTATDMSHVKVWRTTFYDASLAAILDQDLAERALSKGEFAALKALIMEEVPEGEQREYALKRFEKLNPDIFGPETSPDIFGQTSPEFRWTRPDIFGRKRSQQEALENGRVDETAYPKALAAQLKSLACSGERSAPYIVRGLITNGRIQATAAQAPGLAEAILKPDCPVSAALTDADKAALKKIAKEASGAP
jgi:hypothetical protein